MLDRDLAELYGVQTKVLKQAVRRKIDRFPSDFMFELTDNEQKSLMSQIVTLKKGQHSIYLSFAFTEQGIAAEKGEVMFTAKEEEVVANCDHLP
jgi:ORF6N domain